MHIISTHVLEFDHPKTEETFRTKGGGTLQGAPDWIVETDYFGLCKKSGMVQDVTPKPESEPDEKVSVLKNVVIRGTVEVPEGYRLVTENAGIIPPEPEETPKAEISEDGSVVDDKSEVKQLITNPPAPDNSKKSKSKNPQSF